MNAIQRVAIRVDASVEMGMGHLMRCLSLADELARGGAETTFLMRSHAAALVGLIEADGHEVLLLRDPEPCDRGADTTGTAHAHWLSTTWRVDAEQTAEAIDRIGKLDWLIVDHYALDARWEAVQRRRGLRILAIDDLADRQHDCDILLDQNLARDMETRYRNHVPATSRCLLGPTYALLRADFAKARESLPDRSGELKRLLICYGGSDPTNETEKALSAIQGSSSGPLGVDVIVGLSNPHADRIEKLCLDLPGARIHRGADNMAELMTGADLSFGAGGVMSWERCCLGLPAIAMDIAENQVGALAALAKIDALIYLGSAGSVTKEQILEAFLSLLNDPARARRIGEVAKRLVDGQGCHRVRAAMEAGPAQAPSR